MTRRNDMNVFENATHDPDPTDELVRDYLDAEASGVDGAVLLERARRTRRRRIWARRAGVFAAAAASVAVILLAYRAAAPERPDPLPAPPVAVNGPDDALEFPADPAAVASIEPLLADPAAAIRGFGGAFAESGATLASDARCVKKELGGLVSTSLARAGLVL